jgi:hypothetical protein
MQTQKTQSKDEKRERNFEIRELEWLKRSIWAKNCLQSAYRVDKGMRLTELLLLLMGRRATDGVLGSIDEDNSEEISSPVMEENEKIESIETYIWL